MNATTLTQIQSNEDFYTSTNGTTYPVKKMMAEAVNDDKDYGKEVGSYDSY